METPPTQPPKRRRGFPLIALGGAGALIAGLGIAWALVGGGGGGAPAAPPAGSALVTDSSGAEDGKIDPAKPLRCFVQGKYVGEFSLTECATRNGVATDALDVGVDQSGALAADKGGQAILPLPPADGTQPQAAPEEIVPDANDPQLPVASDDSCWRHGGGGWREVAADMDLNACVQALYAGRCARSGASYGRWGSQTLRLVPGRVEISDDNRTFHGLTLQAPDCSVDPIG